MVKSADTSAIPSALSDDLATLIDIGTLAHHLGVTERFVRRLVEERRVPFYKIGKFVRFDPEDITTWIKESRIEKRNLA